MKTRHEVARLSNAIMNRETMELDVLARTRSGTSRRAFLGVLASAASAVGGAPILDTPLFAQDVSAQPADQGLIYQCVMDPEIRQSTPGVCPKCHMQLQTNIPEAVEYSMDFSISPKPPKVGVKEQLTFTLYDPWTGKQITNFMVEHEKLFHLFIVGADLDPVHFVHDHPVFGPDKKFRYTYIFAKPGLYRVLGDCLPDGGTVQLIPKTVIIPAARCGLRI